MRFLILPYLKNINRIRLMIIDTDNITMTTSDIFHSRCCFQ